MPGSRPAEWRPTRRSALKAGAALAALTVLAGSLPAQAQPTSPAMTLTVFIRYQIDPFQKDAFQTYAENWGRIIPRCGGHLIGYFLPHEGTNDIAWGLISFASLAAYESYRARLRSDPEAMQNFSFAQKARLILREERTFVAGVAGTLALPPTS